MRRPPRFFWLGLGSLTLGTLFAAACGADSSDLGGAYELPPGEGGGTGTSSGAGGGGGGLPPEEELESSYGAPVATGSYVWIANPTSGRVAYVDARTLETRVVEAGNAPTYLAAVPDPVDDVAIVLNVLSYDATLLRNHAGELTTQQIPVPSGGNHWAVAKTGRFALAWTDARLVPNADPIDGYQDVTVVDMQSGEGTGLTVGYRPVAVAFDDAGKNAFAITQDGVTVIDLDTPSPVVDKNVKLSDDPLDQSTTRDVSITPDGAFALVRRENVADIDVVDLGSGARSTVTLSGAVTDLDLSPDGSVAVAVVRGTGEVALLPLPAIAADPTAYTSFVVSEALVGSTVLAPASSVAMLYTNAVASDVLTVVDVADSVPDPRFILLRAPILSVFPTPDASHALVLHDAFEVSGGTKYPAALSLVPVALDLPAKIAGVDAPVISVAVSPAGDKALVAAGDPYTKRFQLVVGSFPSLGVERFSLASLPVSAGIVAGANKGFVAQEHPDGRITFVDFETGEVRTLTGFELASQVVTGSKE